MSQNEQNARPISKSLKIQEMPEDIQEMMREFDKDGTGGINVNDLKDMVQAYRNSKRQQRFLLSVLGIVLFALVLSIASTFGVSYAAIQMAKDMEPNDNGVLVLTGHQGEEKPALSPEYTITDGVESAEVAQGLARRLQNVLQDQDSVTVDVTITESRVAEACRLFHQGAATHLVIAIDDEDYRVSPTRFHHSCMFASGSFDHGLWNVLCPGDGEVCDVSVIRPHSPSDRRLGLERALVTKPSGSQMNPFEGLTFEGIELLGRDIGQTFSSEFR